MNQSKKSSIIKEIFSNISKKFITSAGILLFATNFNLTYSAKKLHVGTNAEYKPYEYLEGGKLVGFDIELMEAIGKDLGYEIEWSNMSFEGLLPALQMKKVDVVIAGLSATEERKKAVAFTKPYLNFESANSVIVYESSSVGKKEELKGKTIGVQIGTIQEKFAKALGANVKVYSSFLGALMDLKAQKIDGVIVAKITGDEYLKNMNGVKEIDLIMDVSPGAAIAVRKDEQKIADDFDSAIEKLKNSGEYGKLKEKYFPGK